MEISPPTLPATITDLWYGTSGPRNAQIAIVAESWGATEAYEKKPLVGASGQIFDAILAESGIQRSDCFVTNVMAAQPTQNDAFRFFLPKKGNQQWRGLNPTPWVTSELTRLYRQLEAVQPTIVIACGNYSLWALTENTVSFGSESVGDGVTIL